MMPMPPKFDPARGHRGRGMTTLPAEGRRGDVPPWPLEGLTDAERDAWEQLWATPQAAEWERLRWTRTVARFARIMVAAEQPGANAALLACATSMETQLGLTPKAMRLLLWVVADDELGAQRQQPTTGARARMRAVSDPRPTKDLDRRPAGSTMEGNL